MKMILSSVQSPLGAMLLASDEQGRVRALEFAERRSRLHRNLREQYGAGELTDGPAPALVVNALQRYPIAIVVPCHRVLGVNGDLKEYAWGLHRKRWLLAHEASIEARPTAAPIQAQETECLRSNSGHTEISGEKS